MANILLVGGSGFVSGTIAELAVAAGHCVHAISRGQRALPEGVVPIVADRKDTAAFAAAVEAVDRKWDLVVDVIGMTPTDAEQDLAVFSSRAKHLVFISTDFVYDWQHRRLFQSPDDEAVYSSISYGGGKRAAELKFVEGDGGAMAWTVLRPCHIYGPGSLLGCLPKHGRDPQIIDRLRAGETIELVGGGHFLQQPIFAQDLANVVLGCIGNEKTHGEIYNVCGPDIVESWRYYEIIAQLVGGTLKVAELSITDYAAAHPEHEPFLCHRVYNTDKLRAHGLETTTTIDAGLAAHVASLT